MPLHYTINAPHRLILTQAKGYVSIEETKFRFAELYSKVAVLGDVTEIADRRGLCLGQQTIEDMRLLGEYFADLLAKYNLRIRYVAVVSDDTVFAYLRIFLTHLSYQSEHSVEIARSLDEARRILDAQCDQNYDYETAFRHFPGGPEGQQTALESGR